MVSFKRIFAVSVMGAIIVLGLIHIGVSIGIIVPARNYGAIFRPQIGLCSFNLVVALLALVTGILGVVMLFLENDRMCKVIAILATVLAVFSLASLVTALIINAKSLNYVAGRFQDYMTAHQYSSYARDIVDRVQTEGRCCGVNMWIDWSAVGLNPNGTEFDTTTVATTPVTTLTTTTTTTTMTTTTTTTATNTSAAQSAITDVSKPNESTSSSTMKTSSTSSANTTQLNREIIPKQRLSAGQLIRENVNYGGIVGLPTSFSIVLPGTCCTSEATFISNTTNGYCKSSVNGIVNHFNDMGCSKGLDFTAGNQTMGIGVINSFLAALALVAIGILISPPIA